MLTDVLYYELNSPRGGGSALHGHDQGKKIYAELKALGKTYTDPECNVIIDKVLASIDSCGYWKNRAEAIDQLQQWTRVMSLVGECVDLVCEHAKTTDHLESKSDAVKFLSEFKHAMRNIYRPDVYVKKYVDD